MSKHLFSTGTLICATLVRAALSDAAIGTVDTNSSAASATAYPVTGSPGSLVDLLSDGDPATIVPLPIESATDFQFLRIDLGSAQSVRRVELQNAQGATISQIRCYVSNTASLSNATPGSALQAAQADGDIVTFTGTQTGRYVYISCAGAFTVGTYRIGEARVYVASNIELAQLQGIGVDVTYQSKQLRGPTTVSQYAVDCAYYDGVMECKVNWAGFYAAAIAAALGVAEGTADPIEVILQGGGAVDLPELSAVFETKDTNGKIVRLRLPRCFAPGLSIPFKRDDFAMGDVTLSAYLSNQSDPTSTVAAWEIQN